VAVAAPLVTDTNEAAALGNRQIHGLPSPPVTMKTTWAVSFDSVRQQSAILASESRRTKNKPFFFNCCNLFHFAESLA